MDTEFPNLNLKDNECYVVPIGGCGEFGLNMTLVRYKGSLVVIDCGLMFPDPVKLGVDAIIPDCTPWFEHLGHPTTYLITHGHEDHIGALPMIHKRWPAPIYAPAWAAELIKDRFGRIGQVAPEILVVKEKDQVTVGSIKAEYIQVNHSIPMAHSLLLQCGDLKVFHTGDFKFDATPVGEAPLSEDRLSAIGARGVNLLLADSTNALSSGPCPSESICASAFERLFKEEPGAVFVTTFSSNLWRLFTIFEAAKACGRRVHIAGNGLSKTIETARLGMLPEHPGLFVGEEQLDAVPRSKLVIVCTGCQAEPLSALGRIARNEHRNIKMEANDTLAFSSRMIPGSERAVSTS